MNSMSSACFIRLSRPCAHLCSTFRQDCSSLLAMRKANCDVEKSEEKGTFWIANAHRHRRRDILGDFQPPCARV